MAESQRRRDGQTHAALAGLCAAGARVEMHVVLEALDAQVREVGICVVQHDDGGAEGGGARVVGQHDDHSGLDGVHGAQQRLVDEAVLLRLKFLHALGDFGKFRGVDAYVHGPFVEVAPFDEEALFEVDPGFLKHDVGAGREAEDAGAFVLSGCAQPHGHVEVADGSGGFFGHGVEVDDGGVDVEDHDGVAEEADLVLLRVDDRGREVAAVGDEVDFAWDGDFLDGLSRPQLVHVSGTD